MLPNAPSCNSGWWWDLRSSLVRAHSVGFSLSDLSHLPHRAVGLLAGTFTVILIEHQTSACPLCEEGPLLNRITEKIQTQQTKFIMAAQNWIQH